MAGLPIKQKRFARPAPRGEGQRLRIRSGVVVALFAFNVSVSSPWLKTTLHYTNAAARRIGYQHRRGDMRTREGWMTGTSTSTSQPINGPGPSPLGAGTIIMFISGATSAYGY